MTLLFSKLAHKEIRFLFPILPLFNILAGVGITRIHTFISLVVNITNDPVDKKIDGNQEEKEAASRRRHSRYLLRIFQVLYGMVCLSVLLSFVASSAFVAVSRWNYPGGHAFQILTERLQQQQHHDQKSTGSNDAIQPSSMVVLYMDVATAMAGVSLFQQRDAILSTPFLEWEIHKAGYEPEHSNLVSMENSFTKLTADEQGEEENDKEVDEQGGTRVRSSKSRVFTHLLLEVPSIRTLGASSFPPPNYHVVAIVPGHPRFNVRHLRVETTDAIYVLEHNDWKWIPSEIRNQGEGSL